MYIKPASRSVTHKAISTYKAVEAVGRPLPETSGHPKHEEMQPLCVQVPKRRRSPMAPAAVGSSAENEGRRSGAWSKEEDSLLKKCVETYGEGNWHLVPQRVGLKRYRRSCRLRWVNYLSPNIKRGRFSTDEEDLILRMHRLLGNRWSLIAGRLPGRTANDIKNHWNCWLAKRFSAKPSATNLPADPPARTVVYKPQAHRVSTRMRELLREMYSAKDQRSLNPPSSSQPVDGTENKAEQLLIAPEPSASNLQWLLEENEFALQGGGRDWFLDAELNDLFCTDLFLWDWTKDDDGSSPLH